MREILFRGKRMDNGQWVEAVSILRAVDGAVKEMYIAAKVGMELAVDSDGNLHAMTAGPHIAYYRVDPNTVGQFTGLTDKNGEKIFEGDIVKDHSGVVYPVVFSLTGFYLKYAPPHSHGFLFDLLPLSNYWHAHGAIIEAIGNIHDNPELLDQ